MKLISYGCSITFGTDLPDIGSDHDLFDRASRLTWPALLAKQLNLEYQCFAQGGLGNLAIMDRLLRSCESAQNDLYVINWTFIDRFDYSDQNGRHYNNGRGDYKTLLPGQTSDVAKIYYQSLHSEYRDKLTNLLYVKTAVDYLRSRKAKFLMTTLDDLLFCDRWHAPHWMVDIQNHVRSSFLDFQGKNFLDWSRICGFEISATGHPLQQAHAAAADIMLPAIDAILHKA